MEDDTKYKCYNCGYVASDEAHLKRHKNRKSPCLIREVKPEDINNPNRCIYCNKIFSTPGNLKKHTGNCKVKNGGIHILYEKVKYEETLRIMKEEQEKKNQELEKKNQELLEEFRKLKEQVEKGGSATTINNINNNNNGTVINITNNITVINDFNKPDTSYITTKEEFCKLFAAGGVETPLALVGKIWFNPDHPENTSIHVINTKTGDTLVRENGEWVIDKQRNIASKLRAKTYSLTLDTVVKYFSDPKNVMEHFIVGHINNNSRDTKFSEEEIDKFATKMVDGRRISANNPAIKHELSVRKGMQTIAGGE